MDTFPLVDVLLNQGPAWFMAGVFAWLYFSERKENHELNRILRGTLREKANLPDEDSLNGKNTS